MGKNNDIKARSKAKSTHSGAFFRISLLLQGLGKAVLEGDDAVEPPFLPVLDVVAHADELEALASNALRVMNGEEEAKVYR